MDQQICHVLLIDDDEDDYFLVRERLPENQHVKFVVEWASSFKSGRDAMRRKVFDVILVDYRMGAYTGIDLIHEATAQHYPAPIILLTGQGNYEVDLEAMHAGAADYLNKAEISSSLLERSIRYAIERKQHEEALRKSEQALRESEGRFRIALSNAAIAVFSTDRDLRYTWFYTTAMGSFPEQLIGKRDDEILPAANVADFMALKQRSLEQKMAVREEIVLYVPAGPRIMIVSVEPYFDFHGGLIGVIGACYDVTEQRNLERERLEHDMEKEVQHRLTEYRERERQAIARDLHDGPIQDLSSLIFSTQYLKETIQDPSLNGALEQIRTSLKEIVHDLREMMNELRPPALIRFGLGKAIQYHLEGFREKYPAVEIELNLNPLNAETRLSEQVNLNLFRIYHEAINNIVRHAQATKIQVNFGQINNHVFLEILDNGKGLPEPIDLINHIHKNHFGLAGMKERAEVMGGEFQVFSETEKGTVIQVKVPVTKV